MSGWVYFFGASDGSHIKIGQTRGSLEKRRKGLMSGQITQVDYRLLAAVHGSPTHEAAIKRYFDEWRISETNSTELFVPSPPLLEYVNWLRQQWWTTLEVKDEIPEMVEWDRWCPTPDRRVAQPKDDPERLIQVERDWHGDLAGTPWDRLSTPAPIGEDFYTPTEIVQAARAAMGGIDLDPASHWRANREHRIPVYYTIHRSAFENDWFGRVWLNPPYGEWTLWIPRAMSFVEREEIEQLCMIGPVWAFTTKAARALMDRASAMLLLTPTPEFWGHPDGRTGTNHPHMIVYLGDRAEAFRQAFARYGIPITLLMEEASATTQ